MPVSKQRGTGKGRTYTWSLNPHGMLCYVDPESYRTVTKLWETTELTAFHDAQLAQATKEINSILGEVEKNDKDRERKLSFVTISQSTFSRVGKVWSGRTER